MEEERLSRKIQQLDEAQAKILEARDLIADALHMTGMEMWAEKGILAALNAWTEGVEEHTSITNLKKELVHENNTDPIWTRPLASVKYMNRRDI
ncbi:MAG: hypothetical protein AB7E27_00480 [Candidatus Methanomethylophilaceae archaeon]|jgi:hypothetical protein